MSAKMIKIVPCVAILLAAAGCSPIAAKLDEWGKSMPTYNDSWCEGWFCWNDTTTKQEAFRDKTPAVEGYSPEQNPGAAGMSDPMMGGYGAPPAFPDGMGMPSSTGYGYPSGEVEIPGDQKPWKTTKKSPALPPSPYETKDTMALQGKGELPPGYDPTRPPPPGAIPGVNWPPPPPEGGFQQEDSSDPSFFPTPDLGDRDN